MVDEAVAATAAFAVSLRVGDAVHALFIVSVIQFSFVKSRGTTYVVFAFPAILLDLPWALFIRRSAAVQGAVMKK